MMKAVGKIYLENRDGGLVGTARYDIPTVLRETKVYLSGVEYTQNRRLPSGEWIYRATDLTPHQKDTLELTDIRLETEPSESQVTWDDVEAWFTQIRGKDEPIPMSKVRDLESLVNQARGNTL